VRTSTIKRGPINLAVRRFGTRGPHIVMVHGLASSQHIWDLVVPRLEKRFRVTTIDQRGHGESSKPASGYDFRSMSADLNKVMASLGAGKVVLVGHSFGANVSLETAVRYPKRVAGVMCVDGGMGSMSEVMTWPEAREMLAPPRFGGMPLKSYLAMVKSHFPRGVWSPDVEAIVRTIVRVDGHDRVYPRLSRTNHLRILKAMYDQRPKEVFARVRAPVLIFAARPRPSDDSERDFYEMKKRSIDQIRAASPRVKVEWITSMHDIPLDKPKELATRIARFVRAVMR